MIQSKGVFPCDGLAGVWRTMRRTRVEAGIPMRRQALAAGRRWGVGGPAQQQQWRNSLCIRDTTLWPRWKSRSVGKGSCVVHSGGGSVHRHSYVGSQSGNVEQNSSVCIPGLRDHTIEYRSQRNSHTGGKETDTRKLIVVLFFRAEAGDNQNIITREWMNKTDQNNNSIYFTRLLGGLKDFI